MPSTLEDATQSSYRKKMTTWKESNFKILDALETMTFMIVGRYNKVEISLIEEATQHKRKGTQKFAFEKYYHTEESEQELKVYIGSHLPLPTYYQIGVKEIRPNNKQENRITWEEKQGREIITKKASNMK